MALTVWPVIGHGADSDTLVPLVIGSAQTTVMLPPEDAEVLKRCMSCHTFSDSELQGMGRLAKKKHKRVLSGKKVCTDCHESGEMCCHEPIFAKVEVVPFGQSPQAAAKGL